MADTRKTRTIRLDPETPAGGRIYNAQLRYQKRKEKRQAKKRMEALRG